MQKYEGELNWPGIFAMILIFAAILMLALPVYP